jgi:glycoprotein endo-alpha-1,2-mannosidase
MKDLRPSFSYDSDEEDYRDVNQEAKTANRLTMDRSRYAWSSHTQLSSCEDGETPSNPKRQPSVAYSGYLSRRHAKKFLAVFLLVLSFVSGLLIGEFISNNSNNSDLEPSSWERGNPNWWPDSDITVGAYYYPWHADDFHRGQGYMREQLSTVQKPALGEYDDSDPATISQHLAWSRQANINLWVTSWWGEGAREDVITKDVIMEHSEIGDHKIALFYETNGRIKHGEADSTQRVVPDIEYLCKNYFDHPNYFRIDDKPVLFVYLTRKLEYLGTLDHVIMLMRQAARDEGCDIYIVGDQVFREAPNEDAIYPPFTTLDAVTNYDVYGSMGVDGYAGEEAVRKHYVQQGQWRDIAVGQKCSFIPSASPGYNDLGVRPEREHGPLSRRLTRADEPGSLFKVALRYARSLVDENVQNLLMVNSFNEWHEDTQIEPVVGETTSLPELLTNGIEYQGYGEQYLNILREETRR